MIVTNSFISLILVALFLIALTFLLDPNRKGYTRRKLFSQRGALSADKKTEYKEGLEIPAPVAATTVIYAGAWSCVNAAGYLVPGADTAGLIFHGISRLHVDNSLGGNGDMNGLVLRDGLIKATLGHAITQANVGDNVFLIDDETVDLTAYATNKIFCGSIAEYIDATHAYIDIEPAILQADVATHIADTSSAHAASAISITDAGNNFAAAEDSVEAALQKLSKTLTITLPHFTGWTKDGSAHAIALPAFEQIVPIMIKRAYVNLGTAPGTGKTLALTVNGSALVSIAESNTQAEAEALSIAIAKDTDIIISANETSSGAGANCDIMLVCQVDDGE